MERNMYDINREPYAEPFGWREIRAAGFFSDLTKKLVSSASEKAASAIGAKAGEALGNKLFNRKKPKIPEEASKAAGPSALAVEENTGSELVKLLQVENKLRSAAPKQKFGAASLEEVSQSNIHEIYNRLLSDE